MISIVNPLSKGSVCNIRTENRIRGTSRMHTTILSAQAGDRLAQKPELKKPETPSPVASSEVASTSTSSSFAPGTITIEFQRQRAKEMTKYFKEVKTQQQILQTGTVFGWTRPNEISNGRWVSFYYSFFNHQPWFESFTTFCCRLCLGSWLAWWQNMQLVYPFPTKLGC